MDKLRRDYDTTFLINSLKTDKLQNTQTIVDLV